MIHFYKKYSNSIIFFIILINKKLLFRMINDKQVKFFKQTYINYKNCLKKNNIFIYFTYIMTKGEKMLLFDFIIHNFIYKKYFYIN